MRDKHKITAFYMEMLVLVLVFIGVILLLSQVFVSAKEESAQARLLTKAVRLAENAAELIAGAESREELPELLGENGSAYWAQEGVLLARYDAGLQPDPEGELGLQVSWEEEDGLCRHQLAVSWQDGEPVYELKTAVYRGGRGS